MQSIYRLPGCLLCHPLVVIAPMFPVVAVVLVPVAIRTFPACVSHAQRSRRHSSAAATGPGTFRLPRAQRLTVVGCTRRKVAASICVSLRPLRSARNCCAVIRHPRGGWPRRFELPFLNYGISVLPLDDGHHGPKTPPNIVHWPCGVHPLAYGRCYRTRLQLAHGISGPSLKVGVGRRPPRKRRPFLISVVFLATVGVGSYAGVVESFKSRPIRSP